MLKWLKNAYLRWRCNWHSDNDKEFRGPNGWQPCPRCGTRAIDWIDWGNIGG